MFADAPSVAPEKQPSSVSSSSNNAQSVKKEAEGLRNDYRKEMKFLGSPVTDPNFDQITDVGYLKTRVKDGRNILESKYESYLNEAVGCNLLTEQEVDGKVKNIENLSLDDFMYEIKNLETQINKYLFMA